MSSRRTFDSEFREVAVRIVLESGRYPVDPMIQDDVSGEGIEEDVFSNAAQAYAFATIGLHCHQAVGISLFVERSVNERMPDLTWLKLVRSVGPVDALDGVG